MAGRKLKTFIWFVLIVVIAAGGALWWVKSSGGFSARREPSAVEAMMARTARMMAIPAQVRDMPNPVQLTPEIMTEARRHFADHCASCHANDGSGNTEIGRNFYPKSPDMRLASTQSLSDG